MTLINHIDIFQLDNERRAMRSIWSGSISFGLVNIPVKLYSASEERGVSFDLLHKEDHARIGYAKICKKENKEVSQDEIVKGYEISDGQYVVVNETDFEKADPKKTKTIDILHFSNENEIPDQYYNKPYYLEPDKGSDKPFFLFHEALKKSKKIGVAKFVMKNREHLAILKPFENILLLNQLRFKEEIRNSEPLRAPESKDISQDEMNMAVELINHLTSRFDPDKYHDDYTDELKKIIQEKAQGEILVRTEAPEATDITDLMKALKESIKKEKAGVK